MPSHKTPRLTRTAAAQEFVRPPVEGLCVTAAYLLLYALGYGGHVPWLCLTALAFGTFQLQPGVQRMLSGGDLTRRPISRMVLLLVTGTVFVYMSGWGPILLSGLSLVVALHVRLSGARVWRAGLAFAVLCAAAGQLAIAIGAAPSYMSQPQVHGIAFACLVLCALIIRTIGLSGEARDRAEATVIANERRFRALVQDSADVVTVSDASGAVTYVSPAIRRLLGIDPEDMVASTLLPWIHPDDLPVVAALFDAHAGQAGRVELRARHADGTYRWVESCLRDLTADSDVGGYLSTIRDITERKSAEQRLAYAATHDPLTGLVNRTEFGRALDHACASGETAVLFIDLDGFKQVNDVHGHETGDAMLLAAAELLRDSAPVGGTVGRFGGDEFGIVLAGSAAAEDAIPLARRILERMLQPVSTTAGPLQLRASIGVAISNPEEDAAAGELLRAADVAMYQAKRTGTHRWEVASTVRTAA